MNILVFDIETIPDIEGGQRIFDLDGLDDKSTAKAMFHLRKQQTGDDFLPHHLHKIAAISTVYRGLGDDMEPEVVVQSLGDDKSSEAELLELFFAKIAERTPLLISWNGAGFDLPVIHYRMLKNRIVTEGYWEQKYDNSTSSSAGKCLRGDSAQHIDLKAELASYNSAAIASLNDISLLLGYPGKRGMDGSQVWQEYLKGNLSDIRNYCETDVLNTYLLYLRFLLMHGKLKQEELEREYQLLRGFLDQSDKSHLTEFSKAWQA